MSRRGLVLIFCFVTPFVLLSASTCSYPEADDNPRTLSNEKLLSMTNDLRTKAGLKPLKGDKRIDDAAALHLGSFVEKRDISDQYDGEATLLERLRIADVPCGTAGEVMLRTANVDDVSEFMKRPDIQTVLLNPAYTAAGFAVLQNGTELFIVGNFVQPLETLSAEQIETLVVNSVQLARSRQKLPGFSVVPLKRLRSLACDMAKQDSLSVKPLNPYSGYLHAPTKDIRNFMYTSFDPGKLPDSVQIAGDDPKINSISVGVCFGRSRTYPAGTYWIAIMLYGSGQINP